MMIPEAITQLLGVPERTARRWAAAGRVPGPWQRLLDIYHAADLGALDAAWRGWRLRDGLLHIPDGWSLKPADVSALPLLQQALDAYRRDRTRPAQYLMEF